MMPTCILGTQEYLHILKLICFFGNNFQFICKKYTLNTHPTRHSYIYLEFTKIIVTSGWNSTNLDNTEIIDFTGECTKHNLPNYPKVVAGATGTFINNSFIMELAITISENVTNSISMELLLSHSIHYKKKGCGLAVLLPLMDLCG